MVRVNPTPLGRLLARHAEAAVTEALADTRVVLVTGARQSGKSTLVGVVAKGRDAEWRNLRHLAERIGHDFIAGIVFYTGTQTLPFGPRLRAVPVSALWQI